MLINSPNISGSLTVTGNSVITGSLTVLGSITGAITGSATSASYVEYTNVANKPALVSGSSQVTYSGLTGVPSGIVSGSAQVTYSGLTGIPSGIVSGSSQVTYSGLTGIPSGIVSGSAQIASFGIFATTGSNGFNGSQSITGSLTVTGQVVAQTLNVQQVTSSIVYSSGSNIFGNSVSNVQQFTGSLQVSGSSHNILGNVGIGPTGTPSAELQVGKSSDVTIAMSNSSSVTSGNRGSIAWYNSSVSSVATIRAAAVTDNVGTELQFFTRPAAGSLTQAMTLDANGRLGIGTTSQRGVLDISSGLRTGTLSGLFIGADADTTAGTRTNNTRKLGMIASPHYENASSSVFGISMDNQASNNFIYIGGAYSGYNAATAIVFSTGATTTTETGTERMRITSSGSVGIGTASPNARLHVEIDSASEVDVARFRTINGADNQFLDISVDNTNNFVAYDCSGAVGGDHIFRRGGGEIIRITGTGITFNGDTAAANALDDYEEGTWTPVIRGSSTAGTYELSTPTYSTYTKIGRQVTVSAQIQLQGSITGGGTGYLQITGLPFTKAENMVFTGAVQLNGVNFTGQFVSVKFVTVSASTVIYLAETVDNGGTIDLPISAISAGNQMAFTITYFV